MELIAEGPHDVGLRYRATRSCHIRLSGRADGAIIVEWPAGFRQTMRAVCAYRDLPHALPDWVSAALSPCEKHLLIWPGWSDAEESFPVRVYSQERWAKVCMTEIFVRIGMPLPEGVVVEIPADYRESPTHGPCVAIDLRQGEFLPKKSKPFAVAQMPD